jgi:hypothetical protein
VWKRIVWAWKGKVNNEKEKWKYNGEKGKCEEKWIQEWETVKGKRECEKSKNIEESREKDKSEHLKGSLNLWKRCDKMNSMLEKKC